MTQHSTGPTQHSVEPARGIDKGEPFRLVVVSGGTSSPSSTRLLGDRLAESVIHISADRGRTVEAKTVELRQLSTEISSAVVSRLLGPGLTQAVELLAAADGVIAATPVYKAGASGLFTSFFDVLDDDLLIGKPVVLAATAGTPRHALVIDDQMRGLFAYLRTLPVPTSVFAADEDWNAGSLAGRIERAAFELALLMESGFARNVRDGAWHRYQHEFGSAAAGLEVDLDSDLMRLAAGGGNGSSGKSGSQTGS